MRNILTERIAINGLLTITALTVLFHILVLMGVVPQNIVWGGRITTASELVILELISIGINLMIFAVVALYAGLLKVTVKPVVLKVVLWLLVVLFTLNTVGNLLSNNELEKMLFTPLTLLLAIFCLRLALPARQQP